MRMWQVETKIMCRQHLLGEHRELHTFLGTIKKGIRIDGYITNDLIEPESLIIRHRDVVREMRSRGYKHHSILRTCSELVNIPKEYFYHKINKYKSLNELLRRCPECKRRHKEFEHA